MVGQAVAVFCRFFSSSLSCFLYLNLVGQAVAVAVAAFSAVSFFSSVLFFLSKPMFCFYYKIFIDARQRNYHTVIILITSHYFNLVRKRQSKIILLTSINKVIIDKNINIKKEMPDHT